jgi:hypothetical protein
MGSRPYTQTNNMDNTRFRHFPNKNQKTNVLPFNRSIQSNYLESYIYKFQSTFIEQNQQVI